MKEDILQKQSGIIIPQIEPLSVTTMKLYVFHIDWVSPAISKSGFNSSKVLIYCLQTAKLKHNYN